MFASPIVSGLTAVSVQESQHDLDRDLSEAEAWLARRVALVVHSAAKSLDVALAVAVRVVQENELNALLLLRLVKGAGMGKQQSAVAQLTS